MIFNKILQKKKKENLCLIFCRIFKKENNQVGKLPLEVLVFVFDRNVSFEDTGKWDQKPASKKSGRKQKEVMINKL